MKKIIRTCLLIMILTGFCTQISHAEAKKSFQISYPAKVRCDTGFEHSVYFDVKLTDKADVIKNLKFSSKNLKGFVTGYYYFEDNPDSAEPYAEITFYAKKAGNYKITFSVYNKNKKKLKDCSVKVKAAAGFYSLSPIKKVTLDGKTCSLSGPDKEIFPHYADQRMGNPQFESEEIDIYSAATQALSADTTKSSAAVKFTLRTGLKIREIKVYGVDDYEGRKFTNGKRAAFKEGVTYFLIVYKDSFDGKDHVCTVAIEKLHEL